MKREFHQVLTHFPIILRIQKEFLRQKRDNSPRSTIVPFASMVRVTSNRHLPLDQLLDRILKSGQISRQEYLHLASVLLSNQKATEQECRQINRIFDSIQTGRIKLAD